VSSRFGYVCRGCRLVFPACWYEPAKCQCGNNTFRKANVSDIKQAIRELEEMLAGDAN